ncbi:hypothetical protein GVAV_002858 [Gurleya vavrai]
MIVYITRKFVSKFKYEFFLEHQNYNYSKNDISFKAELKLDETLSKFSLLIDYFKYVSNIQFSFYLMTDPTLPSIQYLQFLMTYNRYELQKFVFDKETEYDHIKNFILNTNEVDLIQILNLYTFEIDHENPDVYEDYENFINKSKNFKKIELNHDEINIKCSIFVNLEYSAHGLKNSIFFVFPKQKTIQDHFESFLQDNLDKISKLIISLIYEVFSTDTNKKFYISTIQNILQNLNLQEIFTICSNISNARESVKKLFLINFLQLINQKDKGYLPSDIAKKLQDLETSILCENQGEKFNIDLKILYESVVNDKFIYSVYLNFEKIAFNIFLQIKNDFDTYTSNIIYFCILISEPNFNFDLKSILQLKLDKFKNLQEVKSKN